MAVALIVAAGRGERLGSEEPKAFVALKGRPMVAWSIEVLSQVCERVVVAVPPGVEWAGGDVFVAGGDARSQSVRNALAVAGDADVVVVHDAARPLVDADLVERCVAALDGGVDAVIAAAPVTDTMKEAADGIVVRTLPRERDGHQRAGGVVHEHRIAGGCVQRVSHRQRSLRPAGDAQRPGRRVDAGRERHDDLVTHLRENLDRPRHHRPAVQRDERLGLLTPKALATTRGHDQRDRHGSVPLRGGGRQARTRRLCQQVVEVLLGLVLLHLQRVH